MHFILILCVTCLVNKTLQYNTIYLGFAGHNLRGNRRPFQRLLPRHIQLQRLQHFLQRQFTNLRRRHLKHRLFQRHIDVRRRR